MNEWRFIIKHSYITISILFFLCLYIWNVHHFKCSDWLHLRNTNGPIRKCITALIIWIFCAHTANHIFLMFFFFDDLFVCLYERINTAELIKLLIIYLRKKKRKTKKEKRNCYQGVSFFTLFLDLKMFL